MYFMSMDTWNTLWTPARADGKANLYATGPIHSRILNGPIKRGLSFPPFSNLSTPFLGATLRYT